MNRPDDVSMKPPWYSRFGYVLSIAGSRHAAALGETETEGDGAAVELVHETISRTATTRQRAM